MNDRRIWLLAIAVTSGMLAYPASSPASDGAEREVPVLSKIPFVKDLYRLDAPTSGDAGVPVLKDIPILGRLYGGEPPIGVTPARDVPVLSKVPFLKDLYRIPSQD